MPFNLGWIMQADVRNLEAIVVGGFPKSGCTWLTRMVADLVECPVVNFLGAKNDYHEIAREGESRHSRFGCYKSHFDLDQLDRWPIRRSRVVYIIRDPRSIFLSGIDHFEFKAVEFFPRIAYTRNGRKFVDFLFKKRFFRGFLFERILMKGKAPPRFSITKSWDEHVLSFLDSGVLCLQYEKLLDDPFEQLRLVPSHLEMEIEDNRVEEVIDRQSFSKRKKEFEEKGDHRRASFLREGARDPWRNQMGAKRSDRVFSRFKPVMKRLGYEAC